MPSIRASSPGWLGPGDGCTFWIDGWGDISWRHCCDVHDIAYLDGTVPRTQADLELALCVAQTGHGVMALVMLVGVTVLGWLFYKRKKSPVSKEHDDDQADQY